MIFVGILAVCYLVYKIGDVLEKAGRGPTQYTDNRTYTHVDNHQYHKHYHVTQEVRQDEPRTMGDFAHSTLWRERG